LATEMNCLDFEVERSKVEVTVTFSGKSIPTDGSLSPSTI